MNRNGKRSMRILFFFAIILTFPLHLPGAEFDPSACPDLKLELLPGNNGFSLFHATSRNYLRNDIGYDYVGISTAGKPSRNRWSTRLLLQMAPGKSKHLNFLMTISEHATKGSDRFFLQLDRPLLSAPRKQIPIKMNRSPRKTLTFEFGTETLTLHLPEQSAAFSSRPDEHWRILWRKDGLDLISPSGARETWDFDLPFRVGFRGAEQGITTLHRRNTSTRYSLTLSPSPPPPFP